jgi:multicomponent Na+:H+ antiporter subunit G
MTWQDWLSAILLVAGCGFYLTGTVGMLRFPDTCSRLHALTKADNLGLLLVCSAMAVHADSWRVAGLLAVVWVFGLAASTVSAHLIARHSLRSREAGK